MQSLVTVGPLPGTVPGTKPYCRYCSAVFPCAGIDTVTPVGLPPKMRTNMRRILYWPYYNLLLSPTGVLWTFLYYPNENQRKSVCWYQECRAYTAGSPIPCTGPIHRPSDLTDDDDFDTYCLYDIKREPKKISSLRTWYQECTKYQDWTICSIYHVFTYSPRR